MTQSQRANQITIKQGLIQLCQSDIEQTYKEFTVMKNVVRSNRTDEQQKQIEYYHNHIAWLRKEYTSLMKELRSMKREFKAYQALDSGNKYAFHMLMTLV